MPAYTIEATIRASARFTLQLEADDEAAAREWARELLDPVGLNVDDALWETPLDTDEGSVTIEKIEPGRSGGTAVTTEGSPGAGDWSLDNR